MAWIGLIALLLAVVLQFVRREQSMAFGICLLVLLVIPLRGHLRLALGKAPRGPSRPLCALKCGSRHTERGSLRLERPAGSPRELDSMTGPEQVQLRWRTSARSPAAASPSEHAEPVAFALPRPQSQIRQRLRLYEGAGGISGFAFLHLFLPLGWWTPAEPRLLRLLDWGMAPPSSFPVSCLGCLPSVSIEGRLPHQFHDDDLITHL